MHKFSAPCNLWISTDWFRPANGPPSHDDCHGHGHSHGHCRGHTTVLVCFRIALDTHPCKIEVTNPAYTYTVIYERIQTCGDGHERVFGDFQSYRLENKSIWVVFRVEFDGDIHFCVAPPKSMVLGVKANGISKTYPISILQEKTILNDSIGETNIVILTSAKTGASRVFNRGNLKMEPVLTNLGNRDPNNLVDQNGNVWKFSEEVNDLVKNPIVQ